MEERIDDSFLECARYGELDELKQYINENPCFNTTEPLSIPWLSYRGRNGSTMLHMASANGHVEMVEWILKYFADPIDEAVNIVNDEGNTPLHWASMNGHADIVEKLILAGCDPEVFI